MDLLTAIECDLFVYNEMQFYVLLKCKETTLCTVWSDLFSDGLFLGSV